MRALAVEGRGPGVLEWREPAPRVRDPSRPARTRRLFLRSSRTAFLVVVLLLACPGGSAAAIRSRALPPDAAGVEPRVLARASATADPVHFLVRVEAREARAARAGGFRLLHPLGDGWWLASAPATALERAAGGGPVAAVMELEPRDRIAPDLAERLAASGDRPIPLRVKAFSDVRFDDLVSAVRRAGGSVTHTLPGLGLVDADAAARDVAALAALDGVRWIEAAPPGVQMANNGMRVDARVNSVQVLGLGGDGVVIGMWDDGVPDGSHPDLAGRVTQAEFPLLTTLHSTHVAGIAIGNGTNSLSHGGGGLQWRGVATRAHTVNWDVFDHLDEIPEAISTYDVDLSQNSWTAIVDSNNCPLYGDYAAEAPEYDAVVTGAFGRALPVVFAAGNERDDADCAAYIPGGYGSLPPPGTAKNVIAVGANHSDSGVMVQFSSWGPTDDGRMKPDISAPGCQASDDFGIKSTAPGGGYFVLCGTSMSAPAVSGSIAVLLADWRAFHASDPRPATFKALLGGFAQDRGPAGPDYRFGLGALNLEASVAALRTRTTVEDEVDDSGTDEWPFIVPAGTDTLRVTLVWDDPPAAELAATTLVNDLDLELEDPASGIRLPFVLDPGVPSALATTGVNTRDNVEHVRVLAPAAGTWIARVRGSSVPLGPQAYSLVGFDGQAPADPASFAASALGDTSVAVTWIRAGDADRAGTLLVRSTAPIAWSPTDGVAYTAGSEPSPGIHVLEAGNADHSGTPLEDAPLAPGTMWHYAAFSYDGVPNYSSGVTDSAQTTSVAVAVPEFAAVAGVRFAPAGPRPASGRAEFRLELPWRAVVEMAVYDAQGRHVATVVRGERDAGSHVLAWDGRDASGRMAAAGVYFVRLSTGDFLRTEKVVRVR